MWSHPVTSETSLWLFECFGLRDADEAGSLVGRELHCELSFCFPGLALLPLLHRRVPAILCEPLDAVCHGLSCIPAQCFPGLGVEYLGVVPQITKHRTCLFTVCSLSSWVAPLRAAQAAHPIAPTRQQSQCLKKCVSP